MIPRGAVWVSSLDSEKSSKVIVSLQGDCWCQGWVGPVAETYPPSLCPGVGPAWGGCVESFCQNVRICCISFFLKKKFLFFERGRERDKRENPPTFLKGREGAVGRDLNSL